ncbi:MAG: DUF2703 domain-containing protein [Halobacteriota archaeon]
MTQSLARCISIEHFHSVNKQEEADAQRGTTELSLREVVHELQGVLEGVTCIALCEVIVGEEVSRLAVDKSESIRITCKELGIASLLLDEILDPNFGMGCCAACPNQANPEACCRTFTDEELDSKSMSMALIVAAILKLTFCSESSKKSSNAKDSLRKKIIHRFNIFRYINMF